MDYNFNRICVLDTETTDRYPAADRQPIPAQRQDRAVGTHRGRCQKQVRPRRSRALQRRRLTVHRGFVESGT